MRYVAGVCVVEREDDVSQTPRIACARTKAAKGEFKNERF